MLLDEHGRRFMLEVHPDAELAPRDVVARGIATAMARQGGRPVLLDATGLERANGAGFLAERFPSITRVTRENGFDWATQPVPVTPAAHYWMGGVRTDLDGRTSIPGLFAVGEAACTGVHGANRLASNSLLESLVFAWRAADALNASIEVVEERESHSSEGHFWPSRDSRRLPSRQTDAQRDASRDHRLTVLEGGDLETHAAAPRAPRSPERSDIQGLLWESVGLERDAAGLTAALAQLDAWEVDGESVAALEDRNLLELGRLLARAALAREESRGAHDRTDFPETREEWAQSLAWRLASAPVTSEVLR